VVEREEIAVEDQETAETPIHILHQRPELITRMQMGPQPLASNS
jgi:hypothetical protein